MMYNLADMRNFLKAKMNLYRIEHPPIDCIIMKRLLDSSLS